ncbi:MAG TPA: ATP-binding protein, partial [Gammaproteobacteria bacterium]|nr:ATP-binding protein [Gammaproteobacteria bacterium]
LKTEIASDAAPVEANGALLESAIVNLVVNARDALAGRGRIAIKVVNAPVDVARAARLKIAAGQYVRIAVVDNGPGIPQDLQNRIFEPFFTTKRDSGGTGLGLSMVRRMAEQSEGTVEIISEVGKGTVISIILPQADAGTSESAIKTMPLSTLPAGDESIVLIAEDKEILATIRQILDVLGYSVHATSDARELPDLVRSASPDLVIIDSTATTTAGAADQTGLGKLAPRARFLYVEDVEGSRDTGAQRNLLIKPFSLMDLASTVRRTLDGDTSE